jgi:hypothetical protein
MTCGNGGITVRTLPLQSGHWRESFDNDQVLKCWNTDACKGGTPAAQSLGAALSRDDYCNAGYEGPCRSTLQQVFHGNSLMLNVCAV